MRVFAILAAALAAIGASCSIPDSEYFGKVQDHPDPTHFTWCNSGEPEYIDPAMATSTTDMKVTYQLFDGLTAWDPDGKPEASVATSWDISPDSKTFTFHLRHDARWSDGTPLTSADFAYGITRVLHPLTASPNGDTPWRLVHGKIFNTGVARLVLRDAPPFRAGEVVTVEPEASGSKGGKDRPPNSNVRTTKGSQKLHLSPDPASATYDEVPGGGDVEIVEVGGPACGTPKNVLTCDWAYVFYGGVEDGVYGWVPAASLAEKDGVSKHVYDVVAADDAKGAERKGKIAGHDLLMLPDVLGIETPDPYTLVLRTTGPIPYLIDLTAQRAFRATPRWVVSRWPKKWVRPEHIVTSGEYHMTFWRERDKFELVKSKTFWGRDAVKVDKVTILSMNDQSANANVYYQGGCDATTENNLPASYYPVLSGEVAGQHRRKDYYREPYLGIYFYYVNTLRFPNVHFRRALGFALDRSRLPIILKGGQIPAASLSPGTPIAKLSDADLALCGVTRNTPGVAEIIEKGKVCYVPPRGPDFDVKQARAELELARKEMGKLPGTITVRFNTGVEYHKTIAEWIQQQWSGNLGLHVELESQEWKTFLKATRNKEYDVARFGSIGNFADPEAEFLVQFRCQSPDNRTGWCNQEFERMYEEAEQLPDRNERMARMHRAEEILLSEMPIIPLYVYTQHLLIKPYVHGVEPNLTAQWQLRRLWIDKDWRAHQPEAAR